MNNKRTFRLDLDLMNIGKDPVVVGRVKQLDGTKIIANLTNSGEPMDLSDCLVRLFAVRQDGKELYQKDYITIEDNIATINCVDELFEVVGKTTLEVEVIDLDGYIETFQAFDIEVLDKINDDTQREIIRVQEVSLLEELKDYIESSSAKIEEFKGLVDELVDPDYNSLLAGLGEVKKLLGELMPEVEVEAKRLGDMIEIANQMDELLTANEEQRDAAESERVVSEGNRESAEAARVDAEQRRVDNDTNRGLQEDYRARQEQERQLNEGSRLAYEETRKSSENRRVDSEVLREAAEASRVAAEQQRVVEFDGFKKQIEDVEEIVHDIPNHGDFNVDVVVKGNLYTTLDGQKPSHTGPATKDAGNVILPYARAVCGATKDGDGIRTIGFVAKPTDTDPDIEITEDQNMDSVFLGTNATQLFLCSKEKYPTVLSGKELAPLATQDWVMRLVDGLGLLDKGEGGEPGYSTIDPDTLFDLSVGNEFAIAVDGKWETDAYNSVVSFAGGDSVRYKPILANPEYNKITFSYSGDTSEQIFIGLWRTENYVYGARIQGNALSVSYFGRDGVRGGTYNLTIRDSIEENDVITAYYNDVNQIWEFYKVSEDGSTGTLVYQLSKFMMSGFPEFYGGHELDVQRCFGFLMRMTGAVHLLDGPADSSLQKDSRTGGYKF